jgi:tRNA:m(5)U-54 methyltransferase
MSVAWFQSRYDKAGPGGTGADYINCPLTREQYAAFIAALLAGDKTIFHEWEASTPYFDGCLPIEVMAERGPETLRHGPMKPFGLTNPHDPTVKAYAIVQLRQDNKLGTLFNMVGFQTKLRHGEQVRIFRTIPGLEQAEFARLGGVHRNTFLIRQNCWTKTLRSRRCRGCASPARSPAAKATSSRPRSACSRDASRRGAARRADRRTAADHRAWRAARPHHRRTCETIDAARVRSSR